MQTTLLFAGSALTMLWGIAHLFPTREVVDGFGDISEDNRNIITMEWIVEGVALIFIGVLNAAVTLIDPSTQISQWVYSISAGGLFVLSLVSLLTGFKVNFLPFKLCPFIFSASAVLFLLGAWL
jgi:hypothetical protein